jgi:hypothetical protein
MPKELKVSSCKKRRNYKKKENNDFRSTHKKRHVEVLCNGVGRFGRGKSKK